MTALLVASAGLLFYMYVGYPALLALVRGSRLPARAPGYTPRVSVLIAARDEAAVLPAKLRSLLAQDYPRDQIEILVVCDGSRDGTARRAREVDPSIRVLELARPAGKPSALNVAVAHAGGEVLIMTDARQPLVAGSLRALVELFADPEVGAVTGELALPPGGVLGFYRRYDDWIRRAEAARRSSIGVTGALWALRRSLYTPVPPETLADDLFLPMMIVAQRRRVVCAPAARAVDTVPHDPRHDFRRRVRTLAGNFQLLGMAPWLLSPRKNPAFLSFLSHKLLRLASPVLLLCMLLASVARPGPLAGTALAAQVLLYGLAVAGCFADGLDGLVPAAARGALAFVVVNAAIVVAAVEILRGRADRLWRPAREAMAP